MYSFRLASLGTSIDRAPAKILRSKRFVGKGDAGADGVGMTVDIPRMTRLAATREARGQRNPSNYSLRLIIGVRRMMSHLPEEEAKLRIVPNLRKHLLAPKICPILPRFGKPFKRSCGKVFILHSRERMDGNNKQGEPPVEGARRKNS